MQGLDLPEVMSLAKHRNFMAVLSPRGKRVTLFVRPCHGDLEFSCHEGKMKKPSDAKSVYFFSFGAL